MPGSLLNFFESRFNLIWVTRSFRGNCFAFVFSEIDVSFLLARSRRVRLATNAERNGVEAKVLSDERHLSRRVKSRGPLRLHLRSTRALLIFSRGGHGCGEQPASLRPHSREGQGFCKTRTQRAARMLMFCLFIVMPRASGHPGTPLLLGSNPWRLWKILIARSRLRQRLRRGFRLQGTPKP